MKLCTHCGEVKTAESFCKNRRRPEGLQIYCRPCMADYQRPFMLMKKFGITVEEYDRMLASQGGVCAICGNAPQKNMLAVDHDHATGAIRGLLCSRCNQHLEWSINHKQSIDHYLGALV